MVYFITFLGWPPVNVEFSVKNLLAQILAINVSFTHNIKQKIKLTCYFISQWESPIGRIIIRDKVQNEGPSHGNEGSDLGVSAEMMRLTQWALQRKDKMVTFKLLYNT